MKLKVLFLSLLLSQILSAQTFTEVPPVPGFDGVRNSSVAFADVDGDSDLDVLITGQKGSGENISKLYTNNGVGIFSEVSGTPFDGVWSGSIAFSDVDGDSDLDILITGENNSEEKITKLYTNDGLGNFSEVMGTPFEEVWFSSIAFTDVDGDNDPDVLIVGFNSSSVRIAKLYTNDGLGNFTEVPNTPFDGVSGAITFSDVDGDNDTDLLIIGQINTGEYISKLYTNDGLGNFTEMLGTPFDGVSVGSTAFADVDGDNDLDVLITGRTILEERISKLYMNDGLGNFTEMPDTPFDGVSAGSIAFSDVDGDSDADVLITGFTGSGNKISKLYISDGIGNFSEVTVTPFDGVSPSSIAFADVDGDEDPDVLITGSNNSSNLSSSKLYLNDGLGNFTELIDPLPGVRIGSIAFIDVDGDNNSDVLITGESNSFGPISKLYKNDGQGNFSKITGTPFDAVSVGSIAFTDVDGDTDPDLLITGQISSGERIAKLYINDGAGSFSEMPDTPFDGVWRSSIAFADVDGDNDSDVLITGDNNSSEDISKLYINDGLGNYLEMMGTPFVGVNEGSIAFSDVDGDNDPDVLITGRKNFSENISKLYTNDGLGNFSEMPNTPFDGVSGSSIAFSDVDGDNDPDILITGQKSLNDQIAKLYTNDGLGNFSEVTETPFEGVWLSSVAFSDVDGDNDPDIYIQGGRDQIGNERISKLYTNDGLGNFTEVLNTPFEELWYGSVAFSDIDGDNDPDLLITGVNDINDFVSKLYINDGGITSIYESIPNFDFEVIIYPNPILSSMLKIEVNSTKNELVGVKIYDLNGRLFSEQKTFVLVGLQTFSVDVGDLPSGTYFVQLEKGKSKGVAKFIVL